MPQQQDEVDLVPIEPEATTIKCLFVGDPGVGKTTLLLSYAAGGVTPEQVTSAVYDSYVVTVNVGDDPVSLNMVDVSGKICYDHLRQMSYPSTDVAIFCFDTTDPESFTNIEKRWLKLKQTFPDVPVILVGTKIDQREIELKQNPKSQKVILGEQGEKLARRIRALTYMECSALRQFGVRPIFDTVVIEGLEPQDVDVKGQGKFSGKEFLRSLLCSAGRSKSLWMN